MATQSNILAWKILWPEEPGGLQSIGSQRVGHKRDLQCLSVGCVTDSLQRGTSASNLLTVLIFLNMLSDHPDLTTCFLCFRPLVGCFGPNPYPGTEPPSPTQLSKSATSWTLLNTCPPHKVQTPLVMGTVLFSVL